MTEPTATAQWVTLLTVVAGFVYQAYDANRRRKWDLEDRKALAKTVTSAADGVAIKAEQQTKQLATAIKENTEISTKAFHEANSVNQKIANIGAEQVTLAAQQNAMQDERDKVK